MILFYNDPREWSCTDDSPFNNGWGYNSNVREEDSEEINLEEDE